MRNFFLFPFAAGPKASASADGTMSYFSPFMPSEECARAGDERNLPDSPDIAGNLPDNSPAPDG